MVKEAVCRAVRAQLLCVFASAAFVCALLSCWMLNKDKLWAAIDQQSVLNSSYSILVPAPDQFVVLQPFPAQVSSLDAQAIPGKKRKRSKTVQRPQQQQQPYTETRHQQLAGQLQELYQSYQQSLGQQDPGSHSTQPHAALSQQEQSYVVQDLQPSPTDTEAAAEAAAQAETNKFHPAETPEAPASPVNSAALDTPALAAFKAILRPRFCWLTPADQSSPDSSGQDLFDTLISNTSQQEAVGLAHETRVVVPARSAFMLGDLRDISRLGPGTMQSQAASHAHITRSGDCQPSLRLCWCSTACKVRLHRHRSPLGECQRQEEGCICSSAVKTHARAANPESAGRGTHLRASY